MNGPVEKSPQTQCETESRLEGHHSWLQHDATSITAGVTKKTERELCQHNSLFYEESKTPCDHF